MTEEILIAIPFHWLCRHWAVAGALATLALIGVIIALNWGNERSTGLIAKARAGKLENLPARPEDIEKHGEQSETILGANDARMRNEAVPFEAHSGIAKPFALKGTAEDRVAALECLSTAIVYEAGNDRVGAASVAQVVLNRVRHAAFPTTVCGIVYQGAERKTGCQFTFTCDGSLRRRESNAVWAMARTVANAALSGKVDKTVGLATHYHTDWVYPYWSPKLRKFARVGTHLFFGWPGYWGGPAAFRQNYRGNEKIPSRTGLLGSEKFAGLSDGMNPDAPKILGLPQAPAKLPAGMGNVPLYGNKLRLVGSDGQSFGLFAPPGVSAAQVVNAALALCKNGGPCRVHAWANEDDVPGDYPIPEGSRELMVFEFVRGGANGSQTLFNCDRFPNSNPKVCLDAPKDVTEVLKGVRFKDS